MVLTSVGVAADRSAVEETVLRTATTVLLENWRGHATVPARDLYPHQWSWDSAFVALGLQHLAPRRAQTELLSLFGAQWADGRVPHIVFDPGAADDVYFPGPSFWRSAAQAGAPAVDTSGLVQPPVHAVAAADLVRRGGAEARAFAARVYPALVAQNDYLRRCRTSPDGLAAVVHPWETGFDNSPAWDAPLAAVPADLGLLDTYTRRDTDHAAARERPTDEDYSRYIRLALSYREGGYDDERARSELELRVVDPAFNALWAWSEHALADLATALGRPAGAHVAEAERITADLVRALWSEADGTFRGRDEVTGRLLPERTVSGLIPLVLPGLPSAVVRRLVETLTGPCFGVGDRDVRGVPSFDRTDDRYDPHRYWRGPTWLNTTWLVLAGLRTHGEVELAGRLRADLVSLVAQSGFREYFDPATGTGHGTDRFSWSAALVLHALTSEG